jgi:phenylacetate-CoA ligase
MTLPTELHAERFDELREQLLTAVELPMYRKLYTDEGVDVTKVSSMEDFQDLPFITADRLAAEYAEGEGRGSFYDNRVDHLFMTPAGDELIPHYFSEDDWEHMTRVIAGHFQRAGLEPDDLVLNCTGYNVFLAGLMFHEVTQQAGAVPVPVGAGNSEQAARMAEKLDVDALIAFPSFAEKIASSGNLSVDLLVSSGEPVINYPERREELRELVGGEATVVDLYGIAEAGPVACECEYEDGMHIDRNQVVPEVIDPGTGDLVETGKTGELVLTHLNRDVMPMIRLRTGDVTTLVERECECGQSLTMPRGVYGRIDNRVKVKGVKVFPDSITPVLTSFPGLTSEFTFEITKPKGDTDRVTIHCETSDAGAVDEEELCKALLDELLITPDAVELTSSLDEEETVVDRRSTSIT